MIWGAKAIWREWIKNVEMTVFQESLIQRGLREIPEAEDKMLGCVDPCLGYTAVLAAECLEEIDKVHEEVTHCDLLVRSSSLSFLIRD